MTKVTAGDDPLAAQPQPAFKMAHLAGTQAIDASGGPSGG